MTTLDVYLEGAEGPIGKLRSGQNKEMSFTYITSDLPHQVPCWKAPR